LWLHSRIPPGTLCDRFWLGGPYLPSGTLGTFGTGSRSRMARLRLLHPPDRPHRVSLVPASLFLPHFYPQPHLCPPFPDGQVTLISVVDRWFLWKVPLDVLGFRLYCPGPYLHSLPPVPPLYIIVPHTASVTLPLNVSLDLGSICGAQHDLATIDTDPCDHVLEWVTRSGDTWT